MEAEQGNAAAKTELGLALSKGDGVAKDDAEAVKWYHKAAEQGDASALALLGFAYAGGQGVAKDEAKAAEWFRKSMKRGFGLDPFIHDDRYRGFAKRSEADGQKDPTM